MKSLNFPKLIVSFNTTLMLRFSKLTIRRHPFCRPINTSAIKSITHPNFFKVAVLCTTGAATLVATQICKKTDELSDDPTCLGMSNTNDSTNLSCPGMTDDDDSTNLSCPGMIDDDSTNLSCPGMTDDDSTNLSCPGMIDDDDSTNTSCSGINNNDAKSSCPNNYIPIWLKNFVPTWLTRMMTKNEPPKN